jgi:valS: valyl-tRNA synthetase
VLGTDHAGISTQTKVDKKLADQGISRLEIGREAFIEACYDWYKEYGTTIVNQIKGMGCSCDYETSTSPWSRRTCAPCARCSWTGTTTTSSTRASAS